MPPSFSTRHGATYRRTRSPDDSPSSTIKYKYTVRCREYVLTRSCTVRWLKQRSACLVTITINRVFACLTCYCNRISYASMMMTPPPSSHAMPTGLQDRCWTKAETVLPVHQADLVQASVSGRGPLCGAEDSGQEQRSSRPH